jgi:flagellar biogenesis protein FliO
MKQKNFFQILTVMSELTSILSFILSESYSNKLISILLFILFLLYLLKFFVFGNTPSKKNLRFGSQKKIASWSKIEIVVYYHKYK